MKKTAPAFISMAVIALFLTACWNPSVKEVPITEPWDKMNLPIKENPRVWYSDAKEVRIVHKARKPDVAQIYLEALEKDGWKLVEKHPTDELIVWTLEKSGKRIRVDIGDFPEGGTNVIIRGLE